MKKVLIVGANSFLGKSFKRSSIGLFEIDELDVLRESWKQFDYSSYDTILHVAAIVHKPHIKDAELYYSVNAKLPVDIAKIAIKQGVKHFVFISSASVWGIGPKFNSEGGITVSTPLRPNDLYGKSKLAGENELIELTKMLDFKLSIIRSPNIYGPKCPGNFYSILEKLARFKYLPKCGNNKFSLIHIDNLCHSIQRIINKEKTGVLCPQDLPILSISERIQLMATELGVIQYQFTWLNSLFNLINWMYPNKYLNNLYGGFYYDIDSFPNP